VNLVTPIVRAWHFRDLIRAILTRELSSRFRGSVLGWIWAIAAPLIMMAAYTVIFSGVVKLAGPSVHRTVGARSLLIFSGITIFNLFAELLYRAPGLLHEHAGFIKKSIFPSETLAWIAVLRAAVYASISFSVLVVFQLALTWHIPWTVIFVPLLAIPLILFLLGAVWFLTALGAFTRDVVHLMATIVPLFMFITPIFYDYSDIPAAVRPWMRLNILGDYIDLLRDLVLYGDIGRAPLIIYGACFVASYIVFVLGYAFFMQYKSVMVDVI
jgi:lipopolysaccharide transport system permease protein